MRLGWSRRFFVAAFALVASIGVSILQVDETGAFPAGCWRRLILMTLCFGLT